jgi:alpha-tubulin suppressor-like RCC1 family protein
LGLSGDSADLNVPKSQSMQLTHQLGILVEACGHSDAIWKADARHNNLLAA